MMCTGAVRAAPADHNGAGDARSHSPIVFCRLAKRCLALIPESAPLPGGILGIAMWRFVSPSDGRPPRRREGRVDGRAKELAVGGRKQA
eukprot:2522366-Rhodomonas_salina.1